MAATTTPPLNSIVSSLRHTYPQFRFAQDAIARWSPVEKTIYYTDDTAALFHELGHAINGDVDYDQDVELLRREHSAWQTGLATAKAFDVVVEPEDIEVALNDYREWLYARSRCPQCSHGGIQQKLTSQYTCLVCNYRWRVNDARQCRLKRSKL